MYLFSGERAKCYWWLKKVLKGQCIYKYRIKKLATIIKSSYKMVKIS